MIAEDLKVLYDIAGNSLNANSVRFACAASNEQLRALIERTSQAEARAKELEAKCELRTRPSRRQIIFNWTMCDDLDQKGGWWGTSDQVSIADELLAALDSEYESRVKELEAQVERLTTVTVTLLDALRVGRYCADWRLCHAGTRQARFAASADIKKIDEAIRAAEPKTEKPPQS